MEEENQERISFHSCDKIADFKHKMLRLYMKIDILNLFCPD